jgi:hypothetical protein
VARKAAVTVAFVTSVSLFFLLPADRVNASMRWATTTALVCATISLARYFTQVYGVSLPLVPFGRAYHTILGASVYGTAGIVSCYLANSARSRKAAVFWAMGAIEIGVFILLTHSRGPIATYAASMAVALLVFPKSRLYKAEVVSGMVSLCLLAVLCYGVDKSLGKIAEFVAGLGQRGDSYRFRLWRLAWQHILTSPFAGNGISARLGDPVAHGPHNLFLSTAYYFGVLALVLLVVALGSLVAEIYRRMGTGGPLLPLATIALCHGVLSVLSDHGVLIKGPSPLWIIYWLPIGIAIAATTQGAGRGAGVNSVCAALA